MKEMDKSSPASHEDVVAFWRTAGPQRWFKKDEAFDREFGERFKATHFAAARRELDDWADTKEGLLALLIVLDQYPRNTFRGCGHMYATDSLARHFALLAIDRGFDMQIEEQLRPFFYLPLMHSELLEDQRKSLDRCLPLAGSTAHFAQEHHDIIERFGRFPHRNKELGRKTTPEELAFLDSGGFAG